MKNTLQILQDHGLDKEKYIIVTSGILNALNIRESDDIDVIVSQATYDKYKNIAGWQEVDKGEYKVLLNDPLEMGTSWDSVGETPNLDDLLATATKIDEVPYANIQRVKAWKQKRNRPKDVKDIELIDKYIQSKT